jgi:hypothetical protein
LGAILRSAARRTCVLITDRRKRIRIGGSMIRHTGSRTSLAVHGSCGAGIMGSPTVASAVSVFLFSFASRFLLLLFGLPLFADLLKFFGSALRAVRLHRDMRIQVV